MLFFCYPQTSLVWGHYSVWKEGNARMFNEESSQATAVVAHIVQLI